MVQKIIWNKTAQRSFDQIINYLQDEFSTQTAEKFFRLVYHRIGQLTEQPYIGRPAKKAKTIRQINIDKYRKMYYRIESFQTFLIFVKALIKSDIDVKTFIMNGLPEKENFTEWVAEWEHSREDNPLSR